MEKFGSIEQFKNVIKSVRDHSNKFGKPLPVLTFIGTVKLHGTNAGVSFDTGDLDFVEFQSRERVLTMQDDNAGFCKWGYENIADLRAIAEEALSCLDFSTYEKLVIFGEWCGPGINKGVAINQLPHKIFVIFNITAINGEERSELSPAEILSVVKETEDIKCIYRFPYTSINIDFSKPQDSQNELVERTLAVEEECPVGKSFGISGVGEGIVWWNHETDLKFKVKGEKHSVSKVKTIKEISATDIERMNSVNEFVDNVCTENRLNQGIEKMKEMGLDIDIKNTGAFIKWVVGDCLKEEADVIEASGFDTKELGGVISAKAKTFWFELVK